MTAVTLTYPLDTIRARLAFQVTGEHIYTGVVHTAVTIFKEVSFSFRYDVWKILVGIPMGFLIGILIRFPMGKSMGISNVFYRIHF